MNKRKLGSFVLCAMLTVLCASAEAQQTGKVPRIGYLDPSTAAGNAVRLDAFRQELKKLGWIEHGRRECSGTAGAHKDGSIGTEAAIEKSSHFFGKMISFSLAATADFIS